MSCSHTILFFLLLFGHVLSAAGSQQRSGSGGTAVPLGEKVQHDSSTQEQAKPKQAKVEASTQESPKNVESPKDSGKAHIDAKQFNAKEQRDGIPPKQKVEKAPGGKVDGKPPQVKLPQETHKQVDPSKKIVSPPPQQPRQNLKPSVKTNVHTSKEEKDEQLRHKQDNSKPCLPSEAPHTVTVEERAGILPGGGGDVPPLVQVDQAGAGHLPPDTGTQAAGDVQEKLPEQTGGQKLPPGAGDEAPSRLDTPQQEKAETPDTPEQIEKPDVKPVVSKPSDMKPSIPHAQAIPSKVPIDEPGTPEIAGTPPPGDTTAQPAETPTTTTTIKPPEEEQEDEIPSFDEWKQKMLAEAEEQEKNKILEAQATQTNGHTPGKIKSFKKSANFASVTCGAKVLSTNQETQNSGFLLTENKDQYLINSCKARKWFVVELCEPVQVQSLEMGNLELFSSLPSSFVVQISERYPTKDWKPIGTFQARDERTVQSFTVGDDQLFAKYIRIEIKNHYGNERYCPLSILRVFGMTVEDDDAEEIESSHTVEVIDPDDIPVMEPGEGAPANLFESAKDTVMSIVKTVLSPGDKENEEGSEVPKDVEQLNADTAANSSVGNVTSSIEEKGDTAKKDPMLPCPPDVEGPAKGRGGVEPKTPDQPKTPEILVPMNQNIPGPASGLTPVTDPPVLTLLEAPGTRLSSILDKCKYCAPYQQTESQFDMSTTCGYHRLLQFIYPTSCREERAQCGPLQPEVPQTVDMASPGPDSPADSLPAPTPVDGEKNSEPAEEVAPAASSPTKDEEKVVEPSKAGDAPEPTAAQESASSVPPSPGHVVESVISSEIGGALVEDTLKPSHTITSSEAVSKGFEKTEPLPASSVTPSLHHQHHQQQGEKPCEEAAAAGKDSPCQLGPEVAQIRPTATEQPAPPATQQPAAKLETVKTPSGGSPGKPAEQAEKHADANADPATLGQEKMEPKQEDENGLKIIYASEPTAEGDSEIETVSIPAADGVTYSRVPKENAMAKLRNKVKHLEMNLNLSSRYLEELSQRYKRKMEDMYVSLNKTIAQLADTSKTAESRDLKQQDRIAHLEKQVENITMSFATVRDDMDSIHSQVIERHLFLMLLEAVIFICMLAWCVNRQQNAGQRQHAARQRLSSAHSSIPNTVKEKPPNGATNSSRHDADLPLRDKKKLKHKRRNSMEGTPRRDPSPSMVPTPERKSYDDSDLHSGRDNDLTIIEPNIPIFITENKPPSRPQDAPHAQKKKKKKKDKQKMCNSNSVHTQLNHTCHNNSSSSGSALSRRGGKLPDTSAEVIFGVQDVPAATANPPSLTSSRRSSQSSASSISNTSSSSQFRERLATAPSGAKSDQHSKLNARKSLDSAFTSSVKSHKHSRSNGSTPSYVSMNGHSDFNGVGEKESGKNGRLNGAAKHAGNENSSTGWGLKWFGAQENTKSTSSRK